MPEKKHTIIKGEAGNKNFFQVPDGYFESFNERILLKIKNDSKISATTRENKIWELVRPQLLFAASFIGLAIIIYSGIYFILGQEKTSNSDHNYIADFMNMEIQNINEDILFEMIELPNNFDASDNSMEDIIIEYLVNTDIDYDLLIKEL